MGHAPERLTRRQRTAINRARRAAREPLLVSIISCWEVALLAQRGRLRFSVSHGCMARAGYECPGLEVVPLSLAAISIAVRLGGLRDPADQLVVATALERGARLVTSDAQIADSSWPERGARSCSGAEPRDGRSCELRGWIRIQWTLVSCYDDAAT